MTKPIVALGVLTVTVAAAVYVHNITHAVPGGCGKILCIVARQPWWADPLALLIGLCGVDLGLAILRPRLLARRS